MRFERGMDPKEAMNIGRIAHTKKIFIDSIKKRPHQKWPGENWEEQLRWYLWQRGIEVSKVIQIQCFPEDYKYRFFYKDCNGEEAHIMRDITLTSRELIS